MKVSNGQLAPDFNITDVYGKAIQLSSYQGRKVHLNFYRFAGCPFCNLRFHEIEKMAEDYRRNNVALLSVFESSTGNIKSMMADEQFYATIIPDPDSSLYRLYDLDRSLLGLFGFLLFKGGIGKAMQGTKLYKQKVKNDGHPDRIEAEFLIGADGKVVEAYYGKNPGDNLPLAIIKNFLAIP